ncbi:hypothetical protein ACTWJ8_39870 (plasmid) [Streptomyces sp. SDT5-1]|uniref:hypothetical protein n=1 Tax=Streptomyces sp. SDT5-1 TaxID=3406418 RepID=UPI003FD2D739
MPSPQSTTVVPDLNAARFAWSRAYAKRQADGVFRQWCEKLRAAVSDLWDAVPRDSGQGVTFSVLDRLPPGDRDFYQGLIEATELLDELIESHDPMAEVMRRHAPLIVIGDALGVLTVGHLRAEVDACCFTCRWHAERLTGTPCADGPASPAGTVSAPVSHPALHEERS